jgi:hypothetical protein
MDTLSPSSRRLRRHHRHLLLCGRLPLPLLRLRAHREGGHRLVTSDPDSMRRGMRQNQNLLPKEEGGLDASTDRGLTGRIGEVFFLDILIS